MIVIQGAGIGGLTLACALEQAGQPYCLIEKAPELSPIGAGIMLQANGLRILRYLGLSTQLVGVSPTTLRLGRPGRQLKLKRKANTNQLLGVSRAALQATLLSGIDRKNIRLGTEITTVSEEPNQLTLTLNNGEQLTADILVNAAGINNRLHAPAQLRHSQQHCWRTLLSVDTPVNEAGEVWLGNQRFGFSPVNDKQVYVFHVQSLPVELPDNRARQAELKMLLAKHSPIPLMHFEQAKWISHPLQSRKIDWGTGRIVALGDAAHALTPNLGQGAMLAMEDAWCLAKLINKGTSSLKLAGALKRHRHLKVAAIQAASEAVGYIAHAQQRWIRHCRDSATFILGKGLHLLTRYSKQGT